MERLWCLLIGYLCGSFLTADLIVWLKTGRTREKAFGNPGTANVSRRLGRKYGLLVFLGDSGKTIIACAIGVFWLFAEQTSLAVIYCGLGASIGHCWPIWKKFHGGKGVAVTLTAALLFFPAGGIAVGLTGLLAGLLTGYAAAGSAVIALTFPIVLLLIGRRMEEILLAMAMGGILLLRHRENFARIRTGQEHRFDVAGGLQIFLQKRIK